MNNEILIVVAAGPDRPWFRERFTPSAWSRMIAEKFHDPYKEQMVALRDVDNRIREWAKDLDSDLKKAKQAFNQRRHLDVAHWIAVINNKLKMILKDGKELAAFEKLNLKEFYNQNQDADLFESYFDEPQLETKAGFLDGLGRMLAGRKLEKNYQNELKKKREALRLLISFTNDTIIKVFDIIANMGKSRASGNLNEYLKYLSEISKIQEKFQEKFKKVYDEHIRPIVEELRKEKEEKNKNTSEWLKENKRLEQERIDKLNQPKEKDINISEKKFNPEIWKKRKEDYLKLQIEFSDFLQKNDPVKTKDIPVKFLEPINLFLEFLAEDKISVFHKNDENGNEESYIKILKIDSSNKIEKTPEIPDLEVPANPLAKTQLSEPQVDSGEISTKRKADLQNLLTKLSSNNYNKYEIAFEISKFADEIEGENPDLSSNLYKLIQTTINI
jgi:hypothetical protein